MTASPIIRNIGTQMMKHETISIILSTAPRETAIAVDCENSDPYKLYSVLKGLNQEELAKIEKITLYDDPNTTAGWDWL